MAIDRQQIIQRIDDLLELGKDTNNYSVESEVTSGTIKILETLYGPNSEKCKSFVEQRKAYLKQPEKRRQYLFEVTLSALGVLKSIKAEIQAGLVENLQVQAQAAVFGDFITAARQALEENNKDVAAVLACAALEDALKRYAEVQCLNVSDADMSQVINVLKSQGVLKDPQATIVQSYVKLRNKAFHAEWDKIEKESVNSAISFTEQFILSNFSQKR